MRICVIDDDLVTRQAIARLLPFRDHEVVVYEDSEPALDAEGRFERIDLILADSNMPTPAARLIGALREMNANIPILVMSGDFRPENRENYEQMGVAGLIDKPVGLHDLDEAIARVLG